MAEPHRVPARAARHPGVSRRKWEQEQEYRLTKELWGFRENRIAVRFEYEWHDGAGQWYRSYGNEMWEFDEAGLMARRFASINDAPIAAGERRIFPPAATGQGA